MFTTYEEQGVIYKTGDKSLSILPLDGLVIQNGSNTLQINNTGFINGSRELLFSNLLDGISKIGSIKASSDDARLDVNKEMVINDDANTQFNTTITTKTLQLTDISTSKSIVLDIDQLNFTISNGALRYSQVSDTGIKLSDAYSSEAIADMTKDNLIFNNVLLNQQIILDNINYSTPTIQLKDFNTNANVTLNHTSLKMEDEVGGLQLEIKADSTDVTEPEPFIRFRDSTGYDIHIRSNGIYGNSQFCYTLDNDTKFMKQNNPFSLQIWPLSDGEYIEKYMPFIFLQNATVVKVRNYTDYLDDAGVGGWNTIITSSDKTVNIDLAGVPWCGFGNGIQYDTFTIEPWNTRRITLVYLLNDMIWVWVISY